MSVSREKTPSTLVTGAAGFVGRRLVTRLRSEGGTVHALDYKEFDCGPGVPVHVASITDAPALARVVAEIRPDRVYHLAAIADPRKCDADPTLALATNAGGTARLLSAVREGGAGAARTLVVSSSAVYGDPQPLPIHENARLRGSSAYQRSKRATERFALRCARHGQPVVVARPFNHSGAGQTTDYVLPALVEQVAAAKREGRVARTGNLHVRRDFLHVDDVVEAYLVLMRAGASGQVYNVCRGRAVELRELLEGIQARLNAPRGSEPDPARVRSGEVEEVVGDASRLRALGWEPRRGLSYLLDDIASIDG